MTSQQEAIFNMFRTTNQVGLNNAAIIGAIPELQNGFTDLTGRITNISGLASLQTAVLSGIAVDKSQLKESMATLTYNYSGPGRAWAAANGDDTTYNALDVSMSKIKRAGDDIAGPMCQGIYGILNTNAAALVPFGLTAAMLNELNTTITDYIAIVPLPSNAINQRQTYTTKIENALGDGSDFLERQLDNIVRGQVNAQPDFVSDYFNAREIIDPPKNSTTFKVTVSDVATGQLILGARVEAVGKNRIAFTDENGFAELKEFLKGTYTILVSKAGYNPQQLEVAIGLGDTKELTFNLTRI